MAQRTYQVNAVARLHFVAGGASHGSALAYAREFALELAGEAVWIERDGTGSFQTEIEKVEIGRLSEDKFPSALTRLEAAETLMLSHDESSFVFVDVPVLLRFDVLASAPSGAEREATRKLGGSRPFVVDLDTVRITIPEENDAGMAKLVIDTATTKARRLRKTPRT